MYVVGFDTETYLITKSNPVPKPVCCTWYDGNRRWITTPGEPATYAVLARPDTVLVGHHVIYDLLVMMRWQPETVPLIIQMADEGRIRDTDTREALWYLQEKGGFGFPDQFSLADLVKKYRGVDISEGKEDADSWRLRYGTLDGVPIARWPKEAIDYAMDDAVWAYCVGQDQGMWQTTLPTEELQIRGALALGGTSAWGFTINQEVRQTIEQTLTHKIKECDQLIGHLGWSGTGSEARFQKALREAWNYKQAQQLQTAAQMNGWSIDWSQWRRDADVREMVAAGDLGWFGGDAELLRKMVAGKKFPAPSYTNKKFKGTEQRYIKADELAIRHVADCYFVQDQQGNNHHAFETLQNRKHYNKLLSTYCKALSGYDVVHAGFRNLVSTGRTGCREPNLQNWPARDDLPMRDMFCARPNRLLGTVDWGALELGALAAVMRIYWPNVRSILGEVLDRGDDPHCLTASIFLNKPYEEIYAGRKGEYKDVRQGSKACYSGDTELLTPNGWVPIKEITTEHQVLQADPHTKAGSFVQPLAVHKYSRCSFIHFKNSQTDCLVTPNHRMLAISRSGYCMEILAEDYCSNEQFSSLHGLTVTNHRSIFTDAETRLAVMIQADGSFNKGIVKLGFTKSRKITRCESLLRKANIPFTRVVYSGVTWFKVARADVEHVLCSEKHFLEWYKYLGESFIDELRHWDGTTVKKNTAQYFSSSQKDVETAQLILVTNGYKASWTRVPGGARLKPQYQLTYYLGDRKKNREYNRLSGLGKTAGGTGTSYCVTVPTGWVLTRRNGKVTVSGNSNFGFPGGLQINAFLSFAESTYGVKMTYQEGLQYHRGWCKTYPEIPGVFLKYCKDQVPNFTDTATAVLPNGRMKADCRYTQFANFHFQGLSADGAKESLYAMWRECVLGGYYRRRPHAIGYGADLRDGYLSQSHTVNFVHDETICEHPEGRAGELALQRQGDIMIAEMSKMFQHKVPVIVESNLGPEWAH